jgi:hypothetical protein
MNCWKEICRSTLRALTTKRTKVHEGGYTRFPWWTFVVLVVSAACDERDSFL